MKNEKNIDLYSKTALDPNSKTTLENESCSKTVDKRDEIRKAMLLYDRLIQTLSSEEIESLSFEDISKAIKIYSLIKKEKQLHLTIDKLSKKDKCCYSEIVVIFLKASVRFYKSIRSK